MSDPELTARARAFYAAFNRRDWDELFAHTDAEFEWTPVDENRSYRGRAAITGYFARRLAAWVELLIEPEELEFAPGRDRMFAALRYRGRVEGSEKLIDGVLYSVLELHDGTFSAGEEYRDRAEALAAFRWRD